MALLVPVGKHLVAFGLEWRRLRGVNRKNRAMNANQETAQYAKEIKGGAQLGLRLRRRGVNAPVVGLLPNNDLPVPAGKRKGKPPKIYAAAELFATTVKEANAALVVVLDESQRLYAFIGVLDHLPATNFDLVGDPATVLAQARAFIRRVKETGVSFYFVGEPGPDFDTSLFDPNVSLPELFTEPTLVAHPEAVLATFRHISLVIPLATLIVALVIGGYMYDDFKAKEAQEERLRASRAAAAAAGAAVQDPVLLYTQSVLSAIGSIPPAATSAEALFRNIGPLPESATPGWEFSTAECASNLACTVTWRRAEKSRATNQALSDARGSSLHFLTDLVSAQETVLATPADSALVDITVLPASQDFLIATGSRFQIMKRAGLVVSLGGGGDGKGGMKVVGSWPEGSSPASGQLVRIGTWDISGDYAMRSALLELPGSMVLTSLLIEKMPTGAVTGPGADQARIKFTAKGNFYVR